MFDRATVFGNVGVSGFIVAGDGNAYLGYDYPEVNTCASDPWTTHVRLLRINSSGAYDKISVGDVSAGYYGAQDEVVHINTITNGDTGVLVTWTIDWPGHVAHAGPPGMAIVTGTSVSSVSPPQVPGQCALSVVSPGPAGAGRVVCRHSIQLHLQPGSQLKPCYGRLRRQRQRSLDRAQRDAPDRNRGWGRDWGLRNRLWSGRERYGAEQFKCERFAWMARERAWDSLFGGPRNTFQIAAPNTNYATTFAVFTGGNASGQGTAIQQVMSKLPQTGVEQLPNLTSPVCWPLPIGTPPFTPTCGNINAIELLTSRSPDYIFQNFIQTFAPVTQPAPGALSPNPVMTFTGPGPGRHKQRKCDRARSDSDNHTKGI